MKNYKVAPRDGNWDVVEIPTGNVVHSDNNPRDSKVIANRLNGGQGFNGWTPSYLLHPLTETGK